MTSFICGILKTQQTKKHNKKEADSDREKQCGYHWGEGSGEGHDNGRKVRGTKYYV